MNDSFQTCFIFFFFLFESRHIGGCGLLAQIKSALSLWNGSFFFFCSTFVNCSVYFECFNENVIFVRLTGKEGQFSHLNLFFWQKIKKKKEKRRSINKKCYELSALLYSTTKKKIFNFKTFWMSILCSMKIIKLN